MTFHDRLADIAYGAVYYIAVSFLELSRLPVIGKPFEALGTKGRFRMVTVPVDARIQGNSAILPFDAVRRLVEAASYVAMADVCLCRQTHRCKDYPAGPGCVYLGEGARTIKYRMRQATKQEALEWLERARTMGLVTNLIWSSVEFRALGADAARTVELCSCCPCCCLMFKTRDASMAYMDNILGFGTCRMIDADRCSRCRSCERACPFRAITADIHGRPMIDEARCKGCGRCAAACRAGALKVFPKENIDGLSSTCHQGTANAGELMERFLAMVK